jgi:hypothetical protein
MTLLLQYTKLYNLYKIKTIKTTPKEYSHFPNAFSMIFYAAHLASLHVHTDTVFLQIHITVTKLDVITHTKFYLSSYSVKFSTH